MRIAWSGATWRRGLARLCIWLAIAGVIVAAARPSVAVEPTARAGILELVIDVSGSTAATDVAPTRLGAIQRATLRLLDRVPPRVRVGLVSFSGTAQTLARPTTDRDAVRRQIASLHSEGPTAIGDALKRALDDIAASRPAVPARVLLVSDGSNTNGSSPFEAARAAAARRVAIFAIAVGTPDGTIAVPDDGTGGLRQIPVPPSPAQLTQIAEPTRGRAVEARSAPELEIALDDLLRRSGLGKEQRDLTMLFAAAALLLLTIGLVLRPPRGQRAVGSCGTGLATAGHWAAAATLLLASAGTAVAWSQWLPTSQPPATNRSAAIGRLATQPLVVAPGFQEPAVLPPPPPVTTDAETKSDRTLIEQASALLRHHGELATQRRAEIKRHHLNPIDGIEISACDVCVGGPFIWDSSWSHQTVNGYPVCDAILSTPVIRTQARRARVPVKVLTAMVVLYEQELCLHNAHSTMPVFDAVQRLARKLHDPLLFDLLYAQIDAGARDWRIVEQAVVILRDHRELAVQRHDEISRRRRNQVGPLHIRVCRGCGKGLIGQAAVSSETGGTVGCDILLDLAGNESDARGWGLPVAQVLASTLVHEQEHCIRDPDDRETPAIDEERRLALKMGGALLLEYVTSSYSDLDRSGHWKS